MPNDSCSSEDTAYKILTHKLIHARCNPFCFFKKQAHFTACIWILLNSSVFRFLGSKSDPLKKAQSLL